MSEELHNQLQQVSQQITAAQEDVLRAQGSNAEMVEEAENKIQQARDTLKSLQAENGEAAVNNSQFQHSFEKLHDVQQQIQEAQQNMNDIL